MAAALRAPMIFHTFFVDRIVLLPLICSSLKQIAPTETFCQAVAPLRDDRRTELFAEHERNGASQPCFGAISRRHEPRQGIRDAGSCAFFQRGRHRAPGAGDFPDDENQLGCESGRQHRDAAAQVVTHPHQRLIGCGVSLLREEQELIEGEPVGATPGGLRPPTAAWLETGFERGGVRGAPSVTHRSRISCSVISDTVLRCIPVSRARSAREIG